MANTSSGSTGSLFFLVGAIVAVIVGLISPSGTNPTLTSVLIILGVIVGFLNITKTETRSFLIAVVSLVVVSSLGGIVLGEASVLGPYLANLLLALLLFTIPAAVIVSLKSIYVLAKS